MDHALAQSPHAPGVSHKKESPGRKKILSSGAGLGCTEATSGGVCRAGAAADSVRASRISIPRRTSISCCVRMISLFSLSSESLLCSRSGCSPGRLPAACLIAFQLRATSTAGCEPFRALLCCTILACNQRANSNRQARKRHAPVFATLAADQVRREPPLSPHSPNELINFSTPS
jgi:hypothetical protein